MPEALLEGGNIAVIVVDTPAEVRSAYGLAACRQMRCREPGAVAPEDWIAGHDPRREAATAPPESVIYTSGTTGKPKVSAAIRRRRNSAATSS